MKKLLVLLLALSMVFTLAACGGSEKADGGSGKADEEGTAGKSCYKECD